MKEADRIERGIITAEGVGAYELGKTGGFVRLGRDKRPHFVDDDRHAAHDRLPGRFRAGKPAADDMDGFEHGLHVTAFCRTPPCPLDDKSRSSLCRSWIPAFAGMTKAAGLDPRSSNCEGKRRVRAGY